ncbi:hypothetical protein DFA_05910 [Cavenderia fasciculata]|uniref:RING-type E3 ubiquitin transferase n=1 Tax=Cavenderia fasciculata TaxID=261658 RepID=F4PJK0_CACFS|nr:uncharacterized protein DFA_05910 [Cavenderia fasciculata]EGG23774.1 hypothetical protein DFA_05910 [Cavenderia fasciculata]|eukprot:XP_004361625.1 hypothetical protein DFA_05910 [Cavenderia fasciculata]
MSTSINQNDMDHPSIEEEEEEGKGEEQHNNNNDNIDSEQISSRNNNNNNNSGGGVRLRSNATTPTNNNNNTNDDDDTPNTTTTSTTTTSTNTTSTFTSSTTPKNESPTTTTSTTSNNNENDNNNNDEGSDMFECNICFDTVNEPIVTQCGHLFCWSCIFQWLQHNASQQCPVCKAPISEEKLIPIYGRGNSSDPRKKRPSSIPSRPPGRPETERSTRAGGNNFDFFGGIGNQWNGQAGGGGGVSFSAGFGLFPGLFGLHFYQTNNQQQGQQGQGQQGNGNGNGGPSEFESIFLIRRNKRKRKKS